MHTSWPPTLRVVVCIVGVAASLVIVWSVAMMWRHLARLARTRPRNVVTALGLFALGYSFMMLGAVCLIGLFIAFPPPFGDRRGWPTPPPGSVWQALEIISIALLPTGVVLFGLGREFSRRTFSKLD